MTTTIPLKVPLEAEPEFGENWASTKTVPEWLEVRNNEPGKWEKLSSELKETIEICARLKQEGKIKIM